MVQMVTGSMDMAGMQRFVTYIYEYENRQKMNNAGYAKIEVRGGRGQVEIHFVHGGIYRGKASVAFLYVESGRLIYIPFGEFMIENGVGNGVISFQTDSLEGTDLSFAKMDGIYIIDSENGMYLSFWKDIEVTDFSRTNFVEYNLDMPLPETVDSLLPEQTRWTEHVQKEAHAVISKERVEDAEQEVLHTMEIPIRNIFSENRLEEAWQNFAKTKMPVQINDEVSAIQIELSELKELPKKYWYLGNNSFLLHGFFNYQHLLFGRLSDGKWFVGVPGIYARQEFVMASVFGFPGFMQIGVSEPGEKGLQETVTPREKQQGVWYHILED